jgi:hypothetical protein
MSNIIDFDHQKKEKLIDEDFSRKTAMIIAKHIATTTTTEYIDKDRTDQVLSLISHYLQQNYKI